MARHSGLHHAATSVFKAYSRGAVASEALSALVLVARVLVSPSREDKRSSSRRSTSLVAVPALQHIFAKKRNLLHPRPVRMHCVLQHTYARGDEAF